MSDSQNLLEDSALDLSRSRASDLSMQLNVGTRQSELTKTETKTEPDAKHDREKYATQTEDDFYVGISNFEARNPHWELNVRIGDVFKRLRHNSVIPKHSENNFILVQTVQSRNFAKRNSPEKIAYVPREVLVKVPLPGKDTNIKPTKKKMKADDELAESKAINAGLIPETTISDILSDFLPDHRKICAQNKKAHEIASKLNQVASADIQSNTNYMTNSRHHLPIIASSLSLSAPPFTASTIHQQLMNEHLMPPGVKISQMQNNASVPFLVNWMKNFPQFQAMAAAAVMHRYNLIQRQQASNEFLPDNTSVPFPTPTAENLTNTFRPWQDVNNFTQPNDQVPRDQSVYDTKNKEDSHNAMKCGLVQPCSVESKMEWSNKMILAGGGEGVDQRSQLKKHGRGRPPYRSVELVVGMGVFEHGRFKKLTVRNKSGIGGKEAIVVRCAAEATEIETAAVHRHKFNNKLIHNVDFTLVYPDGSPVRYLPGTREPFTLKTYKEMRNDSWIRLRLFLCPTKQLLVAQQQQQLNAKKATDKSTNICYMDSKQASDNHIPRSNERSQEDSEPMDSANNEQECPSVIDL